jgi:hypothetical protein
VSILFQPGAAPATHGVFPPFALSLSKGRSWFDKLTTNGVWHLAVGWVE